MSDILRRISSRREWDEATSSQRPDDRKWWQILGDWLAERLPFLRGEEQDLPVDNSTSNMTGNDKSNGIVDEVTR